MKTGHLGIVLTFVTLLTSIGVQANHLLPDSVWTFKNHEEHHHVEQNEIWLSADTVPSAELCFLRTRCDLAHLASKHQSKRYDTIKLCPTLI